MNKPEELTRRTLSLKRTFNAPLKLAWEAWTNPRHIAQWWGPKGMEIRIIEHDFRAGGKWKYVMLMADGNEFISEGIYSEIIAYKKIVTSVDFKPMTLGVEIQVLFEESGNRTIFTLNCVYPTEEYCKQQEKMGFYNGWGSVFNRFEEHLRESGSTL
jgi:uncharacterized protein YndB with AHSA1/START domain